MACGARCGRIPCSLTDRPASFLKLSRFIPSDSGGRRAGGPLLLGPDSPPGPCLYLSNTLFFSILPGCVCTFLCLLCQRYTLFGVTVHGSGDACAWAHADLRRIAAPGESCTGEMGLALFFVICAAGTPLGTGPIVRGARVSVVAQQIWPHFRGFEAVAWVPRVCFAVPYSCG